MGTDKEQAAFDAWNAHRRSPAMKEWERKQAETIRQVFKQKEPPPIRGGAPGPEDYLPDPGEMTPVVDFPAHQFGPELRRQGILGGYGQGGPGFDEIRAKWVREHNPQVLATSVWEDIGGPELSLGRRMHPESEAALPDVADQWTRLRSMFDALGRLQGRN